MQTRTRLLCAALAATMLLSFAVNAQGRRLSSSESRFYIIWTSLELTAAGGIVRVLCPVTLLGSYHSRTISKVSGQLIGFINHAEINGPACTGGHSTILRETLPWHVQYNSFAGTLPTITSVRQQIVGARFLIESNLSPGGVCTSTTTQSEPGFGRIAIGASGEAREVTAEGEILSTGATCPISGERGRFSGVSRPVVGGSESSTTRIIVRLVQ
jgi:hypothetical protein